MDVFLGIFDAQLQRPSRVAKATEHSGTEGDKIAAEKPKPV